MKVKKFKKRWNKFLDSLKFKLRKASKKKDIVILKNTSPWI